MAIIIPPDFRIRITMDISTANSLFGIIGCTFSLAAVIVAVLLFRYYQQHPEIFYSRRNRIILSVSLGLLSFLLIAIVFIVFGIILLQQEPDPSQITVMFCGLITLSPMLIWSWFRFHRRFSDYIQARMAKEGKIDNNQKT
jgi:hypothetical protein